MLEMGAAAFTQLRGGFAFATGLGRFVVFATPGLGQNTFLLNFTAELFERNLKRAIGINNNLCHGGYQRDRLEPARLPLRGWG
jgi:hypothetical protein